MISCMLYTRTLVRGVAYATPTIQPNPTQRPPASAGGHPFFDQISCHGLSKNGIIKDRYAIPNLMRREQ